MLYGGWKTELLLFYENTQQEYLAGRSFSLACMVGGLGGERVRANEPRTRERNREVACCSQFAHAGQEKALGTLRAKVSLFHGF